MSEMRKIKCEACGHIWEAPFGTGKRVIGMNCPKCGSANIHRIDQQGHGFGNMPWGYKKK